jgi:hypothetical protein
LRVFKGYSISMQIWLQDYTIDTQIGSLVS